MIKSNIARQMSNQAFEQFKKALGPLQQRAFDELLKHGDKGLTCKQLEIILSETGDSSSQHESVSGRVNDLKRMGFVEGTGKTRQNPSGASAEILIVPKHVRKGGQPVPVRPKEKVRFTVEIHSTAYSLLLGQLCIGKYTDIHDAQAIAFQLNRHFKL